MSRRWLPFALSLCGTASACSARSEVPEGSDSPPGDYGDAPEGTPIDPRGGKTAAFPTGSGDACRVLDVNKAWLGSPGSVERGANDARDPDGRPNLEYDVDDGLAEMIVSLDAGAATAELLVEVGSDDSAKYWLNVLIDLNGDGRWSGSSGGAPEWPVQNLAVDLDGRRKKRIELPSFSLSSGKGAPRSAWMRLTLTNAMAPKAWDGSGQFGAGEIEDYLVELPETPLVDVECKNPTSGAGTWTFDGQRASAVSCELTPVNEGARTTLPFVITRTKGGVTHSGFCQGAALDPGQEGDKLHGTVDLRSGQSKVTCLFQKEWGLPSKFDFEFLLGRETSKLTAHGVEVGLRGANRDEFILEKGSCLKSCSSSRECFGNQSCNGSCCAPPWALECAGFETADCGRCCAITGGARAADCVREACVN